MTFLCNPMKGKHSIKEKKKNGEIVEMVSGIKGLTKGASISE